jgi:hypothetical protein
MLFALTCDPSKPKVIESDDAAWSHGFRDSLAYLESYGYHPPSGIAEGHDTAMYDGCYDWSRIPSRKPYERGFRMGAASVVPTIALGVILAGIAAGMYLYQQSNGKL